MNKRVKNGLDGTKTMENLKAAASGEAMAYTKYTLFSQKAKDDGYEEIADVFEQFAHNEKEHAELWLEYLGELSDTKTNLKNAVSAESFESGNFYPDASRTAYEEGFSELGDKFRMTGTVEKSHSKTYNTLSKELDNGNMFSGGSETKWVCMNCGYEVKGNTPPDRCPLCSYPKGFFTKNTECVQKYTD